MHVFAMSLLPVGARRRVTVVLGAVLCAALVTTTASTPLHAQATDERRNLVRLSGVAVLFLVKDAVEEPVDTLRLRAAIEFELRRAGLRVLTPAALAADTSEVDHRGFIIASMRITPLRVRMETRGYAFAPELGLFRRAIVPGTGEEIMAPVWNTTTIVTTGPDSLTSTMVEVYTELGRSLANDILAARTR